MSVALQKARTVRWSVLLLLAVAGLFYVKWYPYYGRAFVAADQHSIGHSILMGDQAGAPAPSWNAAMGLMRWPTARPSGRRMVLGLLLGSGCPGTAAGQLGTAHPGQPWFRQHPRRRPAGRTRHDVHLLRGAGGRGPAQARQASPGALDRVLAGAIRC